MSSTKFIFSILFFIGFGHAQVDLGSMESWGFNGVSSDDVVLMSEKKMKISNLVYSGQGPAAWFMVGTDDDNFDQEFTDLNGVIIPDENGGCDRLGAYRGDDIELTLPSGMKFTDYDYLSIYCIRFSHNFGYIPIKKGITFPNATAAATPTTLPVVAAVPVPAVAGVATPPAAAAPVLAGGRQLVARQGDVEDDGPGECDQEPERRAGPPAGTEEEEE